MSGYTDPEAGDITAGLIYTVTEGDGTPLDPSWVSYTSNKLNFVVCDTNLANGITYDVKITVTDTNNIGGSNGILSVSETIVFTL